MGFEPTNPLGIRPSTLRLWPSWATPASVFLYFRFNLNITNTFSYSHLNDFYVGKYFFKIMLVPVRCFTCGKLIAHIYNDYLSRIKQGEEPNLVMDSLKINRYCCRRMFISSVETIYQVIPYYEALRKRRAEIQSEMDG
jgi:DNA-directed RNA polymerase subunit N